MLRTLLRGITLLVGIALLSGCEELVDGKPPVDPAQRAPEGDIPPSTTTATELLVGTYEIRYWSDADGTYHVSLVWQLNADGSFVQICLECVGLDDAETTWVGKWWFYPERRALTLAFTPSTGITVLIPDGWKTGYLLPLYGTAGGMYRIPEPTDDGVKLETPPLKDDDTPDSWAGTYIIRTTGCGASPCEAEVFLELNADGTGLLSTGFNSRWWYHAEQRAFSLSNAKDTYYVTWLLPEGWNGEPVCTVETMDEDGSYYCSATIERSRDQ